MGILARAELLLQAKNYSGSGDWLDETNSHDAQLGSTSGADTNDPLFLSYTGIQYVHLPGVSSNYISTPDAAALDITGDIWIAGRFAMTDWTPSSDQTLIAKFTGTGDERSYRFMVDTLGPLRLQWSTDGTSGNVVTSNSTTAPTVTNGEKLWVAATLDVSSGDVKFYVGGIDPTPLWTQLGTTVSGAGATSIHSGSGVLEIGTDNTGTAQLFIGEIYNVQIENGYDEGVGTLQFDADFTDVNTVIEPFATFTEASSNAATVTINRTSTGRKSTVVDRDMFLLATDDYFEIPDDANLDFAGGDDFTVLVSGRSYSTTTENDVLVAKAVEINATDVGYALYRISAGFFRSRIMDSGVAITDDTSSLTDGQSFIHALVRNTTDDDVEAFLDGTGSGSASGDTTTLTLANAEVFRIGRLSGAGTKNFDGEIHAVVLWREALSDADVAAAGVELLQIDFNSLLLLGVGT